MNSPGGYAAALAMEQQIYANCIDVHALPASFHYWSNRYILPKMLPHGFSSPDGMFLKVLREQCERIATPRFISIGAGNGDLELKLAGELRTAGYDNFVIECLDLNADMLERGRRAAGDLAKHLEFVQGDFNEWTASRQYDAVIANQSLHHVVNLEGLFAQIRDSLAPTGVFAISDMIGRNGHLRWPEALRIVHEFWRELPPSYRLNLKLGGYEEMFVDWDCSVEGFEGIRSQDVLPLLLNHFHFDVFIPFGNVIDPFVDRAFGGHFDVNAEWDRNFLDRVHERDEREMAAGTLTPTHMLAVVSKKPAALEQPAVRRSVRIPDDRPSPPPPTAAYHWSAWPHSPQQELEIACARLAASETGRLVRERTQWALALQKELDARTAQAVRWQQESEKSQLWGKSLERDVQERTAWAEGIEQQLAERTAWSKNLVAALERQEGEISRLRSDVEERTAWAQQLEVELSSRTQWAHSLSAELAAQGRYVSDLEGKLKNPFRYAAHVAARVWRRCVSR